jgi:hypothetical protein
MWRVQEKLARHIQLVRTAKSRVYSFAGAVTTKLFPLLKETTFLHAEHVGQEPSGNWCYLLRLKLVRGKGENPFALFFLGFEMNNPQSHETDI